MIDAADSIVFNIVEGCGTSSANEFARFLDMATKSSSEVQGQLELSHHYGALPKDEWERLTTAVVEIRRMLCGLRKKVLADDPPRTPRRTIRPTPSGEG